MRCSISSFIGMAFIVSLAVPGCASAAPFNVEEKDARSWASLRENMIQEAARLEAEGKEIPDGMPARALMADEKKLLMRLVEGVSKMSESDRAVHLRIVEAETGKSIPCAPVTLVFQDAGFLRSSTSYKQFSADANGVFVKSTDAEGYQINAKGYDLESGAVKELTLGGHAVHGLNDVGLPKQDLMEVREERVAELATLLHRKRGEISVWDEFIVGKKVELVPRTSQTDLDSRQVVLSFGLGPQGGPSPLTMFIYRLEDRKGAKTVHNDDARETVKEGAGVWPLVHTGIHAVPRLKPGQKVRRENLPRDLPASLVDEAEKLGLDVEALCRARAVLLLCDVDKDGRMLAEEIERPEEPKRPHVIGSGTESKDREREIEKRYVKECEAYRKKNADLEKTSYFGLFPRKMRLIAFGGADGFVGKPDLVLMEHGAPSVEKQMRVAPADGYQKEMTIFPSRRHGVQNYSYLRLGGNYGRMEIRMMRHAKKQENGYVDPDVFGLPRGDAKVEWPFLLRMQPDGTRNLHTVGYEP